MKRLACLITAAVLLPAALFAQQPAAVSARPESSTIVQTFRGFGFYGSWLLEAFDSIPASKYGYKPMPAQQSVGYIAQHLEDANYKLCELIGGVKPNLTAKDSLADTIKALWPKDTLIARVRASLEFCGASLSRIDDSKLADIMPVEPLNPGRTNVRVRYLILLVTDLAEHYSQLAVYMRLNGLIPPSARVR